MSKLWTAFQAPYRISMAYQVDVVLIESTRPAQTPLPVLARGQDDRGASAQADLIPPFPAIEDICRVDPVTGDLQPMQRRLSFELNDKLAILGHHFGLEEGDMSKVTLTVRMSTPCLEKPQELAVAAGDATDQQITVQIPNDPANFPAGFYTVSVLVTPNGKPDETRTTNEWPLLVAPQITTGMPLSVARTNIVDGLGQATIKLTCAPEVRPGQRVALALGNLEVRAEPHAAQTGALDFIAKKIGAGTFRVRLRVDGVDSHIVDFTDPNKPQFIESQKVTIT
jgi:Pvc16 N-terminal domain